MLSISDYQTLIPAFSTSSDCLLPTSFAYFDLAADLSSCQVGTHVILEWTGDKFRSSLKLTVCCMVEEQLLCSWLTQVGPSSMSPPFYSTRRLC
jgi:hypothetical protein